jgi:hypothetical protein
MQKIFLRTLFLPSLRERPEARGVHGGRPGKRGAGGGNLPERSSFRKDYAIIDKGYQKIIFIKKMAQ